MKILTVAPLHRNFHDCEFACHVLESGMDVSSDDLKYLKKISKKPLSLDSLQLAVTNYPIFKDILSEHYGVTIAPSRKQIQELSKYISIIEKHHRTIPWCGIKIHFHTNDVIEHYQLFESSDILRDTIMDVDLFLLIDLAVNKKWSVLQFVDQAMEIGLM